MSRIRGAEILIKYIMVALLLVIGLSGIGNATETYCWDWGDETGVYSDSTSSYMSSCQVIYHGEGEHLYIKWYVSGSWCTAWEGTPYQVGRKDSSGCFLSGYYVSISSGELWCTGKSGLYEMTGGTNDKSFQIGAGKEYADSTQSATIFVSEVPLTEYTVSGVTDCNNLVELYYGNTLLNFTTENSYSFKVLDGYSYRLLFDGAYYDFTCDGSDIIFDYDGCIWVYGYTCGVDTIKLYDDNDQLIDTVSQSSGYDIYEMQIADGEEYMISFYDLGIILCYNQTFTCTGDHVLIDFDRCNWVYPPSPWDDPIPIYVWTGYDYNIVVFKDAHGNFIENSKLAIYDKTDNQYIQHWTDASDGYTLLGARFDTDHDVLLSLRTFDGIFTLKTNYPANGSALVGEENITTTNWTIPIKYNLNILPVDQYGVSLFDVFCGLSEYTPLNPGAFWGMDLSDQGYVAVTNCSGFAMCDIIAEKEGYVDYKVEALNWTSKSALVKDYRHNVVMEEE